MMINNIPTVKLAIIAVSRDNFPRALSEGRRQKVTIACKEKNIDIYLCSSWILYFCYNMDVSYV